MYMYVLLKHAYGIEQGMRGEKGDYGRPGVHVSFINVCVCVCVLKNHTVYSILHINELETKQIQINALIVRSRSSTKWWSSS